MMNRRLVISAAAALVALGTQQVYAQKKYAPGVTDTEITIGQTTPFERSSGWLRHGGQGLAGVL